MTARFAMIGAATLIFAATDVSARHPDSRVLSHRTIASTHVEVIAESDGGRLVRLRRKGAGYAFEYYLEYWRGNGGVVVGATFRRGKCRSGDASAIRPTEDAMARTTLDFRIGEYLRECPLARAREAELRRSLDSAWPAFSALAEQARAETEAENQAIADHGKEE
ncbi:MAG TPA: hypothetical protein VIT45_02015 [Allosphingosinicella sp.]